MPTRYLKPGIRDSEAIDQLSPLAEVLFYRLLVTVDDYGRYDGRPAMIKAQCFPIRDKVTAKNCEDLLSELQRSGLVLLYSVDGKPYLQVCKWENIPRSAKSKFPEYAGDCANLHTDVCESHTVLPVTETETKTETKTDKRSRTLAPPEGVSVELWQDFLAIRKEKRAPLTASALEGIRSEAEKAGWSLAEALQECCTRGWQSFKAKWVTNPDRQSAAPTFAQQDEMARRRKWEEMTGRKWPEGTGEFIEIDAVDVLKIGGGR